MPNVIMHIALILIVQLESSARVLCKEISADSRAVTFGTNLSDKPRSIERRGADNLERAPSFFPKVSCNLMYEID
jgi:hypothetical protein